MNKNDVALWQVNRTAVALLLSAAFAACLIIHLRAIGGDFLSDDFAHTGWIAEAHGKGELLDWLVKRLYLPLDSGNYAYRPVVFASYALDWVCYGANAAGWHITNLAIHLANGALILVLAGRLAARASISDARFAAVAAAALLLAIPFGGESTFWPVGRFDLLACMFSLAFLLLLLDAPRRPEIGRTLALLGCLSLALLSKESAMPMVAVGFSLVFACSLAEQRAAGVRPGALLAATAKESLRRYWPVIALALAYFAWRHFLFGSPWKVYPDSRFPASLAELVSRVGALKHVFTYPYAEPAAAWWVLIALTSAVWLAGLVGAARRASFWASTLTIALFCCFLVYLLAPASSFPIASPNGEGTRNLYIPWAMFSLFAAFAIAHHRVRVALLCAALAIAFWGQWRTVTLWQDTAAEMFKVTAAVPALANDVGDAQYALLLLPDHVGAVPFVRNAQGGVVMPPRQAASYLPKMAAMTPLQFAEWEGHIANNKIGELKGVSVVFDRADFSRVYCWLPSLGRFQRLDAKPRAGDPKAWEAETMKEAVHKGCLL